MITAHLTVNIESRAETARLDDLATGLELLATRLREMIVPAVDPITDTIRYDHSEINYTLIPVLPAE
jgi:hypothetical protein